MRLGLAKCFFVDRHLCFYINVAVPDPGSRDRDVVLVSAGFAGETQGGAGIWNGEGMGRG